MNKKILISLSVIGIVAAIAIGGTIAYFSDTETSTGNTFSTGTIDIAIDSQNPWTGHWDIADMKPCETGYINFEITNPGNSPVNIWKQITNVTTDDGDITEPECVYGGGKWDGVSQACDIDGVGWHYTPQHNLDDYIYYDLSVEVPMTNNSNDWHQVIYKDTDTTHQILSHLGGAKIFLGMIPARGSMKVTQSYHLAPEVLNWAQADNMRFDIVITGEQLQGKVTLENKAGDPDWEIKHDNTSGTLTYNMTGSTFDYTFSATGLKSSTKYRLIYYTDPWTGDNPGALIASFTTDGSGNIVSTTGSVDLGMDLPHSNDQNYPEGAKIWLVTANDYNGGTEATGPMTDWNPADYLFDTGLITYDDTDI